MSRRRWFNTSLVIVFLLAAASAALLAYGTDPYWGQFHRGIGMILFTQRLQWVLVTVSLLCCLAVVTMIVAGGRRVFWLIVLGPVLALFAHRILSNPMRSYAILDNPNCVRPDQARTLRDGDDVVGVSLSDAAWAYPFSALYESPVILQSSHEQRFVLLWSPFANRAVAYKIDHEIRYNELAIASMPANALLVYNARAGQFINGVTGLTTKAETPAGFLRPLMVQKMPWGQWKSLHPDTQVLLPRSNVPEHSMPLLPRYPLPNARHSTTQPSTERVIVVATTQPVAIPSTAVTTAPANVSAGLTRILLFRDSAGLLHAYDRHVDGDLSPFFHRKIDPKHPAAVLEDNDSGSLWSADGKCLEGQFKGRQLQRVMVEDDLYWGVIEYWMPGIVWTTPREPSDAAPVFSNPPEPKKRRRK